jgi:uncharacterized protein (DUF58 family)
VSNDQSSGLPLAPEGAAVLGIGVVAATAGVLADWRPLALAGIALVVVVLLGVALVFRRSQVAIERTVEPPRVERGDPAIIYLELVNRGARRSPASVARQVFGAHVLELDLPRLAGGEQGVRVYRLPTHQRGVFPLPPIEVRREDPFRLARTVRPEGGPAEIKVTPRIRLMPGLARGIAVALEGADAKLAQQGTIVFHRLREYVDGDDLRLVHWPSTAKTGQLVVRQHVDVTEASALVVVDDSYASYADPLAFEEALDVAASALATLARESIPSWVATTSGRQVSLGRGQGLPEALDLLTEVTLSSGPRLAEVATSLARDPRGTSVVAITGPLDPDEVLLVAGLGSRFSQVIALSLCDEPAAVEERFGVLVLRAERAETISQLWTRSVEP